MTICTDCLKPCPSHNHTYCTTCHTCGGECDWGGCVRSATTTIELLYGNGTVAERRPMCDRHARQSIEMEPGRTRLGILHTLTFHGKGADLWAECSCGMWAWLGTYHGAKGRRPQAKDEHFQHTTWASTDDGQRFYLDRLAG